MKCPRCLLSGGASSPTEVIETRAERSSQRALRRRRRCKACEHRFTTIEQPKAAVIRNEDGEIEAFDETRLLLSLQRATASINVEADELKEVAEEVRRDVERHLGPLATRNLVGLTLERLRLLPEDALRLYQERTHSIADRSNTVVGTVEKRRPRRSALPPGEWEYEPFRRSKLHRSLKRVLHRRLKEKALQEILDTIERHVGASPRPVPTSEIRDLVAAELRGLEPLAYLHFALTTPGADMDSLSRAVDELRYGLVRQRDTEEPELFERLKLISSIAKFTAGRDSIPKDDIDAFGDQVGQVVRDAKEPVSSDQIGRWVLGWLKQRDQTAFRRYFFAFRNFQTPEEFTDAAREDWDQLPDA